MDTACISNWHILPMLHSDLYL